MPPIATTTTCPPPACKRPLTHYTTLPSRSRTSHAIGAFPQGPPPLQRATAAPAELPAHRVAATSPKAKPVPLGDSRRVFVKGVPKPSRAPSVRREPARVPKPPSHPPPAALRESRPCMHHSPEIDSNEEAHEPEKVPQGRQLRSLLNRPHGKRRKLRSPVPQQPQLEAQRRNHGDEPQEESSGSACPHERHLTGNSFSSVSSIAIPVCQTGRASQGWPGEPKCLYVIQ